MRKLIQRTDVDCVITCISSITDIPYDSLRCVGRLKGKDRHHDLCAQVKKFNYIFVEADYDEAEADQFDFPHVMVLLNEAINVGHAVVCQGNEIIHDPWPKQIDYSKRRRVARYAILKKPPKISQA